MTDLTPSLPSSSRTQGERETLIDMLDYYRAVLMRKGSGLDDEQLRVTLGPSDLTIGGLIYHMALVEDSWFEHRLADESEPEPWASAPWDDQPDWEFDTAKTLTWTEIETQFETSVARSRAVQGRFQDLDVESQVPVTRPPFNFRWMLVHMIEEYARHCGHADLIRQSIDGVTDD